MNQLPRWLLGLIGLAGIMAFTQECGAQRAPTPPKKRSFSNKTPAHAAKAPVSSQRTASQEELVDAVLGDALNQMWVQADAHGHQGEYNHFINLSRIVVQGDPHNMEAFSTSSYLLWSTGRNEEAEAFLKDGIAANPSSFYMYDEMGLYWFIERKNPIAAIPYYEKAVKFDCPMVTLHSLANCYEKAGQWDKAVATWSKATLYTNDLIAITRLRRAKEKLAQVKHSQ